MPDDSLPTILEKFKDVFAEGLGTVKSVQAKLSVDESARPKFCKPRPVPLAMKAAVEREAGRDLRAKVSSKRWISLSGLLPEEGRTGADMR